LTKRKNKIKLLATNGFYAVVGVFFSPTTLIAEASKQKKTSQIKGKPELIRPK
jgi:hypothetical protein